MKAVFLITALVLFAFCGLAENLAPGLLAEYYFIGENLRDFPEIEPQQKPSVKRIDGTIDFAKAFRMRGLIFTNDFFVRWTGKIHITTPDTYKFFLESDDGSQMFIYNRKLISNGGLHGMTEASGEVELPVGDHDVRIEFFQRASVAGCKLSWASRTIEKQIVPARAWLHKAVVAPPPPDAGAGLLTEIYDMGWPLWDFPAFEEYEKSTVSRIDSLIAFPDAESFFLGNLHDHFYCRWNGQVKAPATGEYKFYLSSDDGSRLLIDGKTIIDHGGTHRLKEKSASTELTAGLHELKLEYFQNEGDATCVLRWEGPGFKKEVIPKTALSH